MVIISKTNVDLEHLLLEKPTDLANPDKPIEEPEHANPTHQSTREQNVRIKAIGDKGHN